MVREAKALAGDQPEVWERCSPIVLRDSPLAFEGEWPLRLNLTARLKCGNRGENFHSFESYREPGYEQVSFFRSGDVWVGCAIRRDTEAGPVWLLGMVKPVSTNGSAWLYDHVVIHCPHGTLWEKTPEVRRAGEELNRWFVSYMLGRRGGRKPNTKGPTPSTRRKLDKMPATIRDMLWKERMEASDVTEATVAPRLGVSKRTLERNTGGDTGRETVDEIVERELSGRGQIIES
jgi:hypothetical protein